MPGRRARQPHLDAALSAAMSHLARGELAAADSACRRVLKLQPRNPEALHLMGLIAHRQGDAASAERLVRRAVSGRPSAAAYHNTLGVLLRERGDPETALASLGRALKLRPRFPGACYNLALAHEDLGDLPAALRAYEQACEQDPDMGAAHHARGLVLQALGRLDEARAAYGRALALRPDYAEAHFHLAHARRAESPDDPQLGQIDALLSLRDRPPREVAWLLSARGKLCDDAGEYDLAFRSYVEANRLTGDGDDPETADSRAGRLIAAFGPELMGSPPPAALERDDRIFIVGMPRSGSTLLEALLASHPQVRAGGERTEIPALLSSLEEGTTGPAHWALAHEAALREAAAMLDRKLAPAKARYLTDKLPGNVWNLGFIGRLMPRAPVLITRRDPRDVGLSCFFTRFEQDHAYANDLYRCGRRIATVQRLAGHWSRVLPNPVMAVDYESLVADPAGIMKRVFAHCGLDAASANLDHAGVEAVSTASSWQVRQGIYGRAVGRWRHYQRHLGPLLEGLGPLTPDLS